MSWNYRVKDNEIPVDKIPNNKKLSVNIGHMVRNKNYNLNHKFKGTEGYTNLKGLFDLLADASKETYEEFTTNHNSETLTCSSLKTTKGEDTYNILKTSTLIGDSGTSIISVRFNKQKCRAIFKISPNINNVIFLIACDFDFSLYHH